MPSTAHPIGPAILPSPADSSPALLPLVGEQAAPGDLASAVPGASSFPECPKSFCKPGERDWCQTFGCVWEAGQGLGFGDGHGVRA